MNQPKRKPAPLSGLFASRGAAVAQSNATSPQRAPLGATPATGSATEVQEPAQPPTAGEGETFRAESVPPSGTIRRVPISLVHDNPFNARQIYLESKIKERATSIAAEGQKVPAAAIEHWDRPGEYILIDGGYRKRALTFLGRTEIKILVEKVKSKSDLYRLSRLYNHEREDDSALDDALAWKKLLDDGAVASQDELATMLGVRPGTITKAMAILKLPQAALDRIMLQPSSIGTAAAYELHLLAAKLTEKELLDVLERVMASTMSTRDLEALRGRLDAGKTRKPKETSRHYRLSGSSGVSGMIKEWEDGRVSVEIQVDDPKAREDLVAELRKRFGAAEDAPAVP